jgi:hypothetical protein
VSKQDEGPFDTVGWGPFALPGERKRLRAAEAARLAEIRKTDEMGSSTVQSEEDNRIFVAHNLVIQPKVIDRTQDSLQETLDILPATSEALRAIVANIIAMTEKQTNYLFIDQKGGGGIDVRKLAGAVPNAENRVFIVGKNVIVRYQARDWILHGVDQRTIDEIESSPNLMRDPEATLLLISERQNNLPID